MQAFILNKPSEGLTYFSGKEKNGGYLISNNFNYFEIKHSKDNYYGSYILPIANNKIIVIAYAPQLGIIDELIENKGSLIKFMSFSSRLSAILQDSTSSNKEKKNVYIQKYADFTSANHNSWYKYWCICKNIEFPLTKDIFNSETSQFMAISKTLDTFADILKEFENTADKLNSELSYSLWAAKLDKPLLKTTLSLAEKNKFFPYFIFQLNNVKEPFRDFVKKNKIAFFSSNNKYYKFGDDIPKGDGCMVMLAECFDASLKDKEYIFTIDYNYKDDYSWNLSVNLGEIAELAKIFTHHIDTKNNVKLEHNVYKYMPETCRILFYTNKNNDGMSLEKYIESGDTHRYYYERDETFITLEDSMLKYGLWTNIKHENIWRYNRYDTGIQTFIYAIMEGLTVTKEVLLYKKIYKTDFAKYIISHLIDGAIFWLNPIGKTYKWLKKGLNN